MLVICIDAAPHNADWLKMVWDLPPYKTEEFMAHLNIMGQTLEKFRQLPVYDFAVKRGLIKDDEWVGNE